MKKAITSMMVLGLVAGAATANAFEAGDIIVRAGITGVSPNDDSDKVSVNTLGRTDMEVAVEDDIQLGLNFQYFITDHWAVELLAATPFSHDIDLERSQLDLGDGALAEAKQLPPTLSANYYFLENDSLFQPYAGVGVNYTVFFDEEFTATREGQTFENIELDDSIGLAVQVGFDYMVSESWLVNASVRYINIETTADFEVLGQRGSVDVDVNPFVWTVSAGYKF